MQLGYQLYGLQPRPSVELLEHELDYHLKLQDKNLPRFERLSIGSTTYDTPDKLQQLVREGSLSTRVSVDPQHGLQVVVERLEITYVPGSYVLLMGELTHRLTLHFDELPEDVTPDVRVGDFQPNEARQVGKIWYYDHVLLPGQGVDIRFLRT